MMEYRNIKASMERSGMNETRYSDVRSPARTDGVGVALRRAFTPVGEADDFSRLLMELDRRTQS